MLSRVKISVFILDKHIANKVTLNAYKITDQDVQRLKEAGYSEDAIFEITLCASVGAGLTRLERGLMVLRGGQ